MGNIAQNRVTDGCFLGRIVKGEDMHKLISITQKNQYNYN